MRAMKIRVTTKAAAYELRKRQHIEAGYQIENEQPMPINGLCSFTAVRVTADDDTLERSTDRTSH
jgi:hypothetical protein